MILASFTWAFQFTCPLDKKAFLSARPAQVTFWTQTYNTDTEHSHWKYVPSKRQHVTFCKDVIFSCCLCGQQRNWKEKNWHHNPYTHANTKTSSSDVNRMWDNHLHSGIFTTHRKNKKQQKKTLQINTIHTTKTSPNLLTCIWTFPRKSTRFSSHTRTKNNDSVQKCLLYLVPGVRDETADGFRWLLLRCNLSRRNRG